MGLVCSRRRSPEPWAPSPQSPAPSPHPHVYIIPLPPSSLQNRYILMLHKSETQTFSRTPTVSYVLISFKWPVPLTTNVKCSSSGGRPWSVCMFREKNDVCSPTGNPYRNRPRGGELGNPADIVWKGSSYIHLLGRGVSSLRKVYFSCTPEELILDISKRELQRQQEFLRK